VLVVGWRPYSSSFHNKHTHETPGCWAVAGIGASNYFDSGIRTTMSAPAHGAPEASVARALTPSPETSINSNDSENTVIRKTVRKWYETAKLPSTYQRESFESFGNLGTLAPTRPRPHQETQDMDADTVGWDHENDPANPMNWPKWRKGAHFLVVFLICFVSWVFLIAPATSYREH
jgi:hypothetical protein